MDKKPMSPSPCSSWQHHTHVQELRTRATADEHDNHQQIAAGVTGLLVLVMFVLQAIYVKTFGYSHNQMPLFQKNTRLKSAYSYLSVETTALDLLRAAQYGVRAPADSKL